MNELALKELAFFTDKVSAMADFYRRLFAAEPVAESEDMAIFLLGETKIFIHKQYKAGKGELPPENHFAFSVEDIDKSCHSLLEQGFEFERLPQDYYWGRAAYLRDPDGQLLELLAES